MTPPRPATQQLLTETYSLITPPRPATQQLLTETYSLIPVHGRHDGVGVGVRCDSFAVSRHSIVMHELFNLECSCHGIDAPRQCQWNRVQDAVLVRPTTQKLLTETYSLITPPRPATQQLLTETYSLIPVNSRHAMTEEVYALRQHNFSLKTTH
jgi:hypothetical protein